MACLQYATVQADAEAGQDFPLSACVVRVLLRIADAIEGQSYYTSCTRYSVRQVHGVDIDAIVAAVDILLITRNH